MAVSDSATRILRRIGVKPYPNRLANVEGAYIARADNEASLSGFVFFLMYKADGVSRGSLRH
jgi:hypothetical protein